MDVTELREISISPIIAGYCEIMMDNGTYADLMTEIPGLAKTDFKEQYEAASRDTIEGVTVRFLHYNHLLQNKRATGRPKDIHDIEELERINKKSH